MDATMDELLAQLRTQQATIERLEARLHDVERNQSPPAPLAPGDALEALEALEAPADADADVDPVAIADRRQLLTRAATLTASAVAGGAALVLRDASPAAAAAGTFDGNPAITATAVPSTGSGIEATTGSGFAIIGTATGSAGFGVMGQGYLGVYGSANTDNGTGVSGSSTGPTSFGIGVTAHSQNAVGLQALGGGVAGVFDTRKANAVHLRFTRNVAIPPPPGNAVARTAGDLVCDSNQDLWLCIASGTPGTWRRIGGASSAGAFTALATPKRVYDSRPGNLPNIGSKTPLAAGVARTCDLKANSSGVPAGATSVLLSLVATNTTGAGGGFLTVYRNGIAWPGTSNLNWSGPNQNVAVTTVTAVDSNALCQLYASQSTNVVVDVLGYYR